MIVSICASCANKPLLLKPNVNIETLNLCLNFAEQIESDDKLMYLDGIKTFIEAYNAQNRVFMLKACSQSKKQRLTITIQNSLLIEPSKQVMYVVISTIGIAYPLSGGSFGFAWLAMNGTTMQLQFSSDLSDEIKPVHRSISSWPYFSDLESLRMKHMEQFHAFMFENLMEIEKSLVLVRQ